MLGTAVTLKEGLMKKIQDTILSMMPVLYSQLSFVTQIEMFRTMDDFKRELY